MADDIDIDEHDVLDNPNIKSIFPDLTIVKKEILREYPDESLLLNNVNKQERQNFCDYSNSSAITLHSNSDKMLIKYENLDNTKNFIKPHDRKNNVYGRKNVSPPLKNKIILGSKINFDPKEDCDSIEKLYNARIILINLRPYLSTCNKYCDICSTLFSNENCYATHKKLLHSVSTDKKSDLNIKSKCSEIQVTKTIKLTCSVCEKTFASLSGLYKHKRNIHFLRNRVNKKCKVNTIKNNGIKNSLRNYENVTQNYSKSCFHCNLLFPNMQLLIEHLYESLQTKNDEKIINKENKTVNQIFHTESKILKKETKIDTTQNKNNKSFNSELTMLVYRCPICSYYFRDRKFGSNHLLKKHKLLRNTPLKGIPYDPKCNFCPSEFTKITSYNSHIHKVHSKLLFYTVTKTLTKLSTKDKERQKLNKNCKTSLQTNSDQNNPSLISLAGRSSVKGILKSALFRCNRCDIHFLNSQLASDHSSHMEILINWKCLLCNRIFKKNDELFHKQQHFLTKGFTVYGISESIQVILYNCPKCTVHFEEDMFMEHFSVCGTNPHNHIMCKICNILIDTKLIITHKDHHRRNIITPSSFITVQTEVIYKQNIMDKKKEIKSSKGYFNKTTTSNKIWDNKWLKIYYCNTCKCFVNNGRNFLMHKNGECTNVLPATCILCGLIISQTGISSHGRIHQGKPSLTLQDFKFYDLKSRQLIHPPLPEFPHCNTCEVYFANMISKLRHKCGVGEYKTCLKCNTKFSEQGYKLHMNYHNYRLKNKNIQLKQIQIVPMAVME
ncbi:zinc finger protein Xfin-like [Battus philenor]|uniref:zinc finger protein Xfin-like n=1 Tax=Battus philenor TaxID=42288 RepID=UPI0035D01FAB